MHFDEWKIFSGFDTTTRSIIDLLEDESSIKDMLIDMLSSFVL